MTQTKTRPQLTALPPADSLGARFCQWFSHPWNWISAFREKLDVKPQWHTETRYPLEPRNLWKRHQDPHKYKLTGLRFGDETRYCLIDVDRGSPYHPANNFSGFKEVLAALEEIGLTRNLDVRSSESEGIHVYYFLPVALPTFALACVIRAALENAGLQLRPGELESFPNVKSYSKGKPSNYNAHRLPLQFESYLLDDDGQPLTDDVGQFLDAADAAAAGQDLPTLLKAIADSEGTHFKFIRGKSSRAEEWKRHLEERIAEGWTGKGQTNELLKDFATYGVVWQALSGDALINFVVETAKAAPGYQQHCGHQNNIRQRAAEWAKSAEGWYSPYRSFPKRDGRSYRENFEQAQNNIVKLENGANVSRRQQATDRIQQAMAHLQATDTLPYGATARAASIIATVKELTGRGMSLSTLHQPCHLSLWHPRQQKSLEPAQGELLHPVLEAEFDEKSLEPAQGELLHPTPLYEGLGPDGGQPQPPQGVGALPPIQPLENSRGEREGGDLPTSTLAAAAASAPSEETAPAAPVALAAPADAPAVLAVPVTPADIPVTPAATPTVPKVPMPTGSSQRETWRLMGIRLEALRRAKRAVQLQTLAEGCLLDSTERQRRETIAFWQFVWDSGEPVWMQEVKLWLAADPSRKLDLSMPAGADSASIPEAEFDEKSLEPAQGELLHPTPLYEGLGPDGGQPQPPQGVGALPPIQPLENSRGEREGGDLPTSTLAAAAASAPSEETAPAAPVALAAPADAPAVLAVPVTPADIPVTPAATPTVPKVPMPTGSSQRETWRLMGIRLEALRRAKRAVQLQTLAEGCLLDSTERQRRETIAFWQFVWDSGEPVWMQEVKLWLAADPSRKLDLSMPAGADSASIPHENVTGTS